MRMLILAVTAAVLVPPNAVAADPLTQADLLKRLIDLDRLTTPPPVGEKTGMFSSYDRASTIDRYGKTTKWDANADWGQFIRQDPDGWDVMAEMKGPGVITRIWSANPHGQVRFILDDKVVIDAPFEDLFNGKLAPFAEPLCYRIVENGGKNCYFPIAYARSCKVVIRESKSYYQINHVSFPRGTQVETFSPQLDEAARKMLDEVSTALTEGMTDAQLFGGRSASPESGQWPIRKGEPLTWEIQGAGTIRAFRIALTDRHNPRDLYALHKCILRMYWDGEKQPSVEAPLIDFFGSGFDFRAFGSVPIGTEKWIEMGGQHAKEDWFMYCYFPMPFSKGAYIEIENPSRRELGVMVFMNVEKTEPAADSLRFKARFRREDPCQVLDYPVLRTSGRGRVVGCLFNVDTPRAEWWGEGDDKVWIDGERFPSYFGTGSEDYLGDAWGLREHIRPFQGVTRRSNPTHYGKSSAYRWHIADSINFQKSIKFTIENWQHGRSWDTYYSTIAYWYGEPGAKHFFKPLSEADVTPPGLRLPGSMEIEGRASGAGAGTVMKEKFAGGVELSGGAAVNIKENAPVTIEMPSNFPRVAKLKLRVHPRRAFEEIRVVDPKGRHVGTVKYTRAANGLYDVGPVRLEASKNPFTVTSTTKAVLDCWVLEEFAKTRRGFEAEDLRVVSADGAKTQVEDFALAWSGGSQLVIDFRSAGARVTLALPSRKDQGPRAVVLGISRGPRGGQFQALWDGEPLGEPFDCHADEPMLGRVALGTTTPGDGEHTLGFAAVGGGSSSAGTRLGLDVVELFFSRGPFAIECENLNVVGSEGTDHIRQALHGDFSGEAQIWCRSTEPGAWIEFAVPVAKAGKYKLSIVYTTSRDYGIVQTYVNGKKAGEAFDTFGPLQPGPIRALGTFDLPAEPLRIKAVLTGKSEQSPGFYFGVDCVLLEPA